MADRAPDPLALAVDADRPDLNPSTAVAAIVPRCRLVAGVTLHPLTMAVYLLLERTGNPLVVGGRAPTGQDIMEAAWALSHQTSHVLAAMENGSHQRRVIEWCAQFSPRMAQDLTEAIAALVKEAFEPVLPVGAGDADDPKAPGPSPAMSSAGP